MLLQFLCLKRNRIQNHQTFVQLLYNQFWRKFTHLLFLTLIRLSYKKWLYRNENTKRGFGKACRNNWAYRVTESYHQPSKKQTTLSYCYIIRPKKCVWWGWPPVNAKSVRISPSTSKNKNTNDGLCHIRGYWRLLN